VAIENTVNNEQDQRTMSKTTNATAAVQFGASAGGTGAQPIRYSIGEFQPSYSNGNAQLTSNRVFTDQMSAVVVDSAAEWEPRIEGYRSRVVAGEERVLRITGNVRQPDILIETSSHPNLVANSGSAYLGRGPYRDFRKPELTSDGSLNRLWPF